MNSVSTSRPSGTRSFRLRTLLPDGRQPPLAVVEVREIWRPTGPDDAFERSDYAYELLDHERNARLAFHLHDAERFIRRHDVVVHEHCERRGIGQGPLRARARPPGSGRVRRHRAGDPCVARSGRPGLRRSAVSGLTRDFAAAGAPEAAHVRGQPRPRAPPCARAGPSSSPSCGSSSTCRPACPRSCRAGSSSAARVSRCE